MVNAGSLTDELPRHQCFSHLLSGVSVVIVTHNRPRLLKRAIASVCATESVLEIVVIDNASTDETPELCASLPAIKYVRLDRPQTIGAARNVGLIVSRGEFVTFLDDDDVRLTDSLTRQLEWLEQRPDVGFIYGQALIGDSEEAVAKTVYPKACPEGDVFWRLMAQNFVPNGSVIFRRASVTAAGLFDDRSAAIEDWDMCVRIAEMYPVAVLKAPVMIWKRSAPDSRQITSNAATRVSNAIAQFTGWMKLPRARESTRKTRSDAWRRFSDHSGEHLICEAVRALRHGLFGQSLRNVLTLFKLEPFTLSRIVIRRWPQLTQVFTQKQQREIRLTTQATKDRANR